MYSLAYVEDDAQDLVTRAAVVIPKNTCISKRKNGRIYLYIEKGYRDKTTKKSRSKVVKSLGYLDVLEKQYPDPIAHFKELARKMTEDEKAEKRITLTINTDEQLPKNAEGQKNFGYAVPLKIYHDLELHRFFNNKARHEDFKFNTNSIMILLIISRLLYPSSKKKAFEDKGMYFERFSFSLDDIYRALRIMPAFQKNFNIASRRLPAPMKMKTCICSTTEAKYPTLSAIRLALILRINGCGSGRLKNFG